jgi:hypothetical protein
LLDSFLACTHPTFRRRSVLWQALGAVGRLGLDVGGLVEMEPPLREAAVKAAARRATAEDWWAGTEGMTTMGLLRELKEHGVL